MWQFQITTCISDGSGWVGRPRRFVTPGSRICGVQTAGNRDDTQPLPSDIHERGEGEGESNKQQTMGRDLIMSHYRYIYIYILHALSRMKTGSLCSPMTIADVRRRGRYAEGEMGADADGVAMTEKGSM
jgi:hypothetical protein